MGMGVLGWVHLGKNLAGLFLSPAAISLLSSILIASKKKKFCQRFVSELSHPFL